MNILPTKVSYSTMKFFTILLLFFALFAPVTLADQPEDAGESATNKANQEDAPVEPIPSTKPEITPQAIGKAVQEYLGLQNLGGDGE